MVFLLLYRHRHGKQKRHFKTGLKWNTKETAHVDRLFGSFLKESVTSFLHMKVHTLVTSLLWVPIFVDTVVTDSSLEESCRNYQHCCKRPWWQCRCRCRGRGRVWRGRRRRHRRWRRRRGLLGGSLLARGGGGPVLWVRPLLMLKTSGLLLWNAKGREKNNLFLSFLVLHRRMLKRPIFPQIKGGGGPSVIYAHCRTNGYGRSKKGIIREKGLVIMENKKGGNKIWHSGHDFNVASFLFFSLYAF